jgi:hypothetical protein
VHHAADVSKIIFAQQPRRHRQEPEILALDVAFVQADHGFDIVRGERHGFAGHDSFKNTAQALSGGFQCPVIHLQVFNHFAQARRVWTGCGF